MLYLAMLRDGLLFCTIFFALAILVLGGTRYALQRSAEREEATVAALVSRTKPGDATTLAVDIATFNDSLVSIDQLQTTYTKWSVVLERFLLTLPRHNTINSLDVHRETATITAVGVSATREDFQALQKAFTDSDVFTNTTLPTPDLLERASIPFTLTTHFTP